MATEYKNLLRKFFATESAATALARQMFYAEDTKRLGMVLANGMDREFWWAASRLAATDGVYGAALLGIDGITGITPEGGASGGPGTMRDMARGLAAMVNGTPGQIPVFSAAKELGDSLLSQDTEVVMVDGNVSLGEGFALSVYGVGEFNAEDTEYLVLRHRLGYAEVLSGSFGDGVTRPLRLVVETMGGPVAGLEVDEDGHLSLNELKSSGEDGGYEEGEFEISVLTGVASDPGGTAYYVRSGKMVTIHFPPWVAAGNGLALTIGGIPAHLRPTVPVNCPVTVYRDEGGMDPTRNYPGIFMGGTDGVFSVHALYDSSSSYGQFGGPNDIGIGYYGGSPTSYVPINYILFDGE